MTPNKPEPLMQPCEECGKGDGHFGFCTEGAYQSGYAAGLAARTPSQPDPAIAARHTYANVDREAPCPLDGFPAWTHDPAQVVMRGWVVTPSQPDLSQALEPATTLNDLWNRWLDLNGLTQFEDGKRAFIERAALEGRTPRE